MAQLRKSKAKFLDFRRRIAGDRRPHFALGRRSSANRRRFADDRRLSSIFAGISPSFRRSFRRRFAFANRRRNEGDFKTLFFRNEGDSPATIEKFFENISIFEGEPPSSHGFVIFSASVDINDMFIRHIPAFL